MAKRRRRRSKSNVGNIAKIAALAFLIVAVIVGFSYFKWIASKRVTLDQATNCPVTGLAAVTAVLLDMTDAVSKTTLLDLKNRFWTGLGFRQVQQRLRAR